MTKLRDDYAADGEVVTKTISIIRLNKEQAGHSFHEKYEKPIYNKMNETERIEKEIEDISKSKNTETSDSNSETPKNKKGDIYSGINNVLYGLLEAEEDLYKLCCVPKNASQKQLRSNFLKLSLLFHPDKASNIDYCSIDPELKKYLPDISVFSPTKMKNYYIRISKAFEVLSNEVERIKYDSTLFFDNYLPLEIDEANFFEIAKKNLEKESFFINESPIPNFGDKNLPLEEVQKLYNFWRNATSWRDFSLATLYDKSTGCDKDERRSMVKENQRRISKLQKYNNERLAKFIVACEKADPRLKQKDSAASKKVDPKLLNRQRLEKKMKDATNMKNAIAQIKSVFTNLTSKPKDSKKVERLSKALNQWLTKATLDQIMQLQANLKFESFLFSEPSILSANRMIKIVDKTVNNQL